MSDKEASRVLTQRQRSAIRSLFAELPEAFHERYKVLQAIREQFHLDLADALLPALRHEADQATKLTPKERRALAYSIRQSAEGLGLRTVCPETGAPAILTSEEGIKGIPDSDARFAYHVPNDIYGHEDVTVSTFTQLPEIRLGFVRDRFADEIPGTFKPLGRGR